MKATESEIMEAVLLQYANDKERAHCEADKLLCRKLCELGFSSAVKRFEDAGLWCA